MRVIQKRGHHMCIQKKSPDMLYEKGSQPGLAYFT